jgi:hypothetical protein
VVHWTDVRRLVLALPETTEQHAAGTLQWRVKDKLFVWERPLRKSDLVALGNAAPPGAILAARVADLVEKEALLAEYPEVCFTTPHFDGYPAVLVRLERVRVAALRVIVTEAWLAKAPRRLAATFIEGR